jgi:nitrous oxide reductase accessory protein NosL
MKRLILGFITAALFCSALLAGCNGGVEKPAVSPAAAEKVQYQCPMKCTEQLFDKPGKCPVCEMELIKVTKS